MSWKMKKANSEMLFGFTRRRSARVLILVFVLYLVLMGFEVPLVFRNGLSIVYEEGLVSRSNGIMNSKPFVLQSEENLEEKEAPIRPFDVSYQRKPLLSTLNFSATIAGSSMEGGIFNSARHALELGRKLWEDIELIHINKIRPSFSAPTGNRDSEMCPHSVSVTGDKFSRNGKVLVFPCGLTLGSHITVIGKPRGAHVETDTKISLLREGQYIMVSQFMMELQGLKAVEGEDPPRILHFNPRLKGDWSGKPVIEMNTCYRMQWGTSHRCEGWRSRADEAMVDEMVKCERWIRDDDIKAEESKAAWWLTRLIARTKKVPVDWPFPFVEDKVFVLTLTAGLEGYHVHVHGRHVTSFPYRTGFALEDATGLSINGDVDIQSIFAASLPSSHPNSAPQRHLDLSERWKAPPILDKPVQLFIGILSAGNHFAERMAVRKSWMQHNLIKTSKVVARFFVALHERKEVNIELRKEAEFFGDIVIVPYMDNYDLVVLKTVAICDYGVRTVDAKYIMKGDDDTFVRVDAIIDEARKLQDKSFYIGNMNYYHKPQRSGKWAVTYEEWLEESYPPYANGPGYILSSDIARYILSEFHGRKLRLFKMEDVSVGMWVENFNDTIPVEYAHSLRFCQFGCVEDYITAHYQSPRQMLCLWDKLIRFGRPSCCNMR